MYRRLLVFIGLFFSSINGIHAQDDCATAIPLTVGAACTSGNNFGATLAGDYTTSCWGDGTDAALWFSFVCPPSGVVTISTDHVGTSFDTQIALLGDAPGGAASCPATMYEYGCDDDGGTGTTSLMTIGGLVPGQTYWIQLDGFFGAVGTYCIDVVEVPCTTDVGTFTITHNGSPVPYGSTIYMCNDDPTDCFTITSNDDYVLPSGVFFPGPPGPGCMTAPELFYAIFSAPPSTGNPDTDPNWTGFYWTGEDITECGGSASPGVVGTTDWFLVPITVDDGDDDGGCGGLGHDQDGDGCFALGTTVLETIWLDPITTGVPDVNCNNGVLTVQVFGGLPLQDGVSSYNVTTSHGTVVSSGVGDGGYVVVNGLSNGDNYTITISDGVACSVDVTGTFTQCCPSGAGDFSFTSPVECDDPAFAMIADETALAVGTTITPCYYVLVAPSNANAGNTIEYFEGATSLGTLNVTANTIYSGYLSYVDPAATNTFELCETVAGTDMTYYVMDCNSGNVITSGTWVADGTGCQTINVTPPAGNVSGTGTWTITNPVAGPGITATTNWGAAVFDPSVAGVGTHTVEYSWDAGNGCTETITNNIVVNDVTPPTITCPGNQTGNVDANCDFTLPDYTGLATANDNCSVTVTQVPAAGTIVSVGTTNIVLTATDGGGNTVNCNFDVVVSDNTAPTITCPGNQTGNVDANCDFSIPDYTGLATANDNCSVTVTQVPASGTIVGVGTTNIVLTATDGAGNSVNCNFDVVVSDNTAPTLTCPGNQTGNVDANCDFSIPDYTGLATANDNCSVTVTQVPASGTIVGVGTTNILLTATDGAGNSVNCNFDVVVSDNTAPTLTCPGNQTGNVDANCDFSIPDYTGLATANDNCSVTVTQVPASGTIVGVGTTNIVLTATDGAGNSVNCNFDVVVSDNTAPTLTCPGNQSGNVDANCDFSIPDYTGLATANDNCSVTVTQVPASGTIVGVGTTNIVLTATDGAGNSVNCNFDVVVSDNTAPTLTCPGNQTGNVDANCDFSIPDYTGLATANDNCSVTVTQVPASGTIVGVGTTNIVLTATDGAGNSVNCNFDVVVSDNTAPTLTCPGNQTGNVDANCDFSIPDYTGLATANDNCSVTVTQVPASGTIVGVGTTNIVLTATDGAGNSVNCNFDVVVSDNTAPTITCPGNQIENFNASCQFTLPDYTGLATTGDNCGVASVTQSPVAGTVISGNQTITLTVTDVNGNTAQCTFDVIPNDVTPPTAVCQNITVYLDGTGSASIVAADVDGGSTDNCGVPTLSIDINSFDCTDLAGPVTVTLTASDGINTDNCTAQVTVLDTVSPAITCPGNTTANVDASCNYAIPDFTGTAATDNCSVVVTQSPAAGTNVGVGTQTITLTATDPSGNTTSCTFDIVVSDNTAPTVSCPLDQNVDFDANCNYTLLDYSALVTANDNCGIASLVQSPVAGTVITTAQTVSFTATDVNGNTASCSFDVIPADNTNPNAICQNISINLDPTGNITIVAADIDGGSTDNCGIASLAASQTAFDCNHIGANSVDLTVTDLSGNSSTCTATVTVVDPNVPTVSAGSNDVICSGDTYTLSGSLGGSAVNGTWSSSGDGGFSNVNDPAAVYTPGPNDITNGTVTLTFLTDPSPCATATADMILTINPTPVPVVGTTTDPSGCGICDGSIVIGGLTPNTSYDISYDDISGTVNLPGELSNGSGEITLTNLCSGSYTNFSATLNGCTGTDGSNVSLVDPSAPIPVASFVQDPITCGGTEGIIEICGLLANTNYDNLSYSSSSGVVNAGAFLTDGTGCFQITGLNADTYSGFSVTLSGCTGSDAGSITLTDPNAPTFTVALGTDPSTCGGVDGTIDICGLTPNTTYDALDYDDPTSTTVNFGPFTTDGTGCFQIPNLGAGAYTNFNVTLSNCTGTDAGPVTLTDPNAPTFTVALGTDPSTCGGVDGTIDICGLTPNTTYDALDYDDPTSTTVNFGSFTTDAAGCFQIPNLGAGAYTNFNVTLSNCTGTDAGPVTLTDPNAPTFTVALGTDPTTCGGVDGTIDICGLTPNTTYDALDYDDPTSTTVNFGPFTTDAAGCFQIPNLGAGAYTNFNVTLSNCTGTDAGPVTLTDPNAPTFTVALGTDPSTCGGVDGTIDICGLTPNTTYDALDYDDPTSTTVNFGSFTTDAAGCFQIPNLGAGAYTNFNVTLSNCTGTDAGPVTLTDPNAPTFTVALGTDPSTCGGVDGTIDICGLTPNTTYDALDYDDPTSTTVNFGSFTTDAAGCFQIPNLGAGAYTNFNVTLSNCTGTDAGPVTLTDPNAPTFTVALGTDPTTCGGVDGTIDICGLIPNTTYDALDYDDPTSTTINFGSFTTDASGCFQIPNLGAGAYTNFNVTLSNCTGTDAGPVTLTDPNAPTFTVALGTDPSTCGGVDGTIDICGLTPNTTYDALDYDDPTSTTINFGSFTTDAAGCFQIPNLGAGAYTNFNVTLSNCTGTEAGPVTLTDPNAPIFTVAGNDPTTCLGADGFITISGLDPNSSFDISYDDGTGTITLNGEMSDATGVITISGLSAGSYTNFVITLSGCTGTDNSVINLSDPTTPSQPVAGTSATFCEGDAIPDLTVAGSGGTFDWYITDTNTPSVGSGTTYTPSTANGTITYLVTETQNGCTSIPDTVVITIEQCVFLELTVPTGFTPDGDGTNDEWVIENLGALYPNAIVKVYNRWGNIIFESEAGYPNAWDGTFNGGEMPVASYYFLIEFNDNGTTDPMTGTVTIIRN